MRGLLCGFLAILLVVQASGCIVASSHVKGCPQKGVVVIDDTIYVVDVKTKSAQPVARVCKADSTVVEFIAVETNGGPDSPPPDAPE